MSGAGRPREEVPHGGISEPSQRSAGQEAGPLGLRETVCPGWSSLAGADSPQQPQELRGKGTPVWGTRWCDPGPCFFAFVGSALGSGQASSGLRTSVTAAQGFLDSQCPIQQEGELACLLVFLIGDLGLPLPGLVKSHAHLDQRCSLGVVCADWWNGLVGGAGLPRTSWGI